jgi:toxin secretion/phage lysis holin
MVTFLKHTWDLLFKGGMMLSGFFMGIMGDDTHSIRFLLVFMIADYITGMIAGLLKKSPRTSTGGLSSRVGAQDLMKKGLMLLVIVVANALDRFVNDGSSMFQGAVTWFYISNEGLSLLENLALCGVPIPQKLKMALEYLSDNSPVMDDFPEDRSGNESPVPNGGIFVEPVHQAEGAESTETIGSQRDR